MVLLIALMIALVAGFIGGNVRVPEGTLVVVERLGKFHKVLQAGRHFTLPVIDQVAYRIPFKEEQDTFRWDIPTADGPVFHITLGLQWTIQSTEPEHIMMVAYQFQDHQKRADAFKVFVTRSLTDYFANRNTAITFMDFEPFTMVLKPQLAAHMQAIGYKLTGMQLKDLYRD